ncbi:hypothetical protein BKA59DRAFT_449102 [Fusarium tricinctum]|uniref:Uncharacterized protein n=1 Tax=Fusarium tricinctum TaxID=61284 RepID=A0A8K0SDZ3_9HYPO|nr:hypothetical protein BKA59DRAFT_449102 [Fusarium tricinctum]
MCHTRVQLWRTLRHVGLTHPASPASRFAPAHSTLQLQTMGSEPRVLVTPSLDLNWRGGLIPSDETTADARSRIVKSGGQASLRRSPCLLKQSSLGPYEQRLMRQTRHMAKEDNAEPLASELPAPKKRKLLSDVHRPRTNASGDKNATDKHNQRSFLLQKQKDAGEYGALGLVCDSRFHPTSHNTKMPPRAPDLTNLATLLEKYLHQVGVGSKEGRTPGEGSPLRRKTARSKGS